MCPRPASEKRWPRSGTARVPRGEWACDSPGCRRHGNTVWKLAWRRPRERIQGGGELGRTERIFLKRLEDGPMDKRKTWRGKGEQPGERWDAAPRRPPGREGALSSPTPPH